MNNSLWGLNTEQEKSKSLYVPIQSKIIRTKQMTEYEKFFEIEIPGFDKFKYFPGQFVELSLLGIGEAPISISSSPTKRKNNSIEVCVRNVGTFTNALHQLDVGDTVGVRGPYGRPFPVDDLKGNNILFVAGGLGIIPLRSMINFVIDKRRDFGKIHILLGCKEPKEILFKNELLGWSSISDVKFLCTIDKSDPDWKGNVGLITQLIPGVDIDPFRTYALVVGPPVMYKFVIEELKKKEIDDRRIILSLERRMKCGLGKCGHCQINDKYCCQDGPTFTYEELKDIEEAL